MLSELYFPFSVIGLTETKRRITDHSKTLTRAFHNQWKYNL